MSENLIRLRTTQVFALQGKLISRNNIDKIMNIENRNRPTRHVVLAESIEMLSGEFNARLSQEKDSLMNLMQTQT